MDTQSPTQPGVPAATPAPEPPTQQPVVIGEEQSNAPGVAIVSWLAYAFWGWVAVATAALVATSANFALNGYSSNYEGVAYVIAGALVVLPIALVCDILFSKREKNHKVGVGAVIMVIHAVLFALLAVGALITLLFSFVSLVLSDAVESNGPVVTAITAGVLVVVYSLLFIRTIWPKVGTPLRLIVRLVLVAIVVLAIAWGIVGPVVQTLVRKTDDRALQAAAGLYDAIEDEASLSGKLPESVADIDQDRFTYAAVSAETIQSALDEGIISYTPDSRPPLDESDVFTGENTSSRQFYTICVTLEYDDVDTGLYQRYQSSSDDRFEDAFLTNIKVGENCYEMSVVTYDE